MSLTVSAAARLAAVSHVFSKGIEGAVTRDHLRKALQTSPKKIPSTSAAAMTYQGNGQVGKANVRLFRHWAEHSEWIRAAINIRRDQVANAEWQIGPLDSAKPFSQELADKITLLLQGPNLKDEFWSNFIQPIVEDLLVLDAGVIEKEFTLRGQIAHLHQVDGGTIKVSRWWDGDPDEDRYFWYPDHQQRASFINREMIYMMQNPATYRVVGLSPLETLKLTIDAELSGHAYNTRQVQNAAPDGMLDLGEAARPEQVDDFKRYWAAEVAGKGAMAFIGGSKNAKFIPFRATNRDMQLLEWQIYLVRKIAAVFGLSPMDLGMAQDVNRSTADVAQDNTDDRGIRPILGTIQAHMTREVVQDVGFGGPANNLAFKFTALNLKESSGQAQINRYALAGVPWKSVNDARRKDGLPPLEGDQFEKLIANTSTGLVVLDDIPTAREYLESKKPAPGEGRPSGSDASTPRKGMEELDGSIAVPA